MYAQRSEKVYMCFYDLQKAFDSVQYPVLLQRLYDAGINGRAWRLLKSWYTSPKGMVQVNGSLSSMFTLELSAKRAVDEAIKKARRAFFAFRAIPWTVEPNLSKEHLRSLCFPSAPLWLRELDSLRHHTTPVGVIPRRDWVTHIEAFKTSFYIIHTSSSEMAFSDCQDFHP